MSIPAPPPFRTHGRVQRRAVGEIGAETFEHQARVADRVLAMLEGLSDITDGFAVDQLTHSLQTATRAEESGADPEMVVASLCHDIGKYVSVPNHPRIAAEILRPYVRDEIVQVIVHPPGLPRSALLPPLRGGPRRPGALPRRDLVRPGRAIRRRVRPEQLRPRLPDEAAVALRAPRPRRLRQAPHLLMVGAVLAPFTRARARTRRRQSDIRGLVMELARADFRRRHPDVAFGPVLVLIASYLEADNIGAVLKAVPTEVDGLAVSTLVVVDGGDDGTEDIVAAHGAFCAVLPVNMGHGVALRLGYELAGSHGAAYVVTLDADGQNDPTEIPDLLAPVLADEADFVIASRRLGVDETSDDLRHAPASSSSPRSSTRSPTSI